ncbi:MAG: hypothetical protein KF724_13390 [Phycisphaeraceae bacterium]|nr:hypothetical protein [Phycisphaeraceae bacterium]
MTRERMLEDLLSAAIDLAEARRQDSDTAEEWDALERAIIAAESPTEPIYAFEGGWFLRRSNESIDPNNIGVDAVDLDDLEVIARSIEEDVDHGFRGWFVVDELVAPSGRTWTRCLVAVECLKRMGLLRERGLDNRIYLADGFSADKAVESFRREAGLPRSK